MTPLTLADLRFINRVAARKFIAADPAGIDAEVIEKALATRNDPASGSAFARAAQLVATLTQRHAFSSAPLQTAVLLLHCSLSWDGLQLLAPQGVLAGMLSDVAAGGDPARLSRWLEDRAVPASGSG